MSVFSSDFNQIWIFRRDFQSIFYNRQIKFAGLSVTIICKLTVSTDPSQGIYEGDIRHSVRSITWIWLSTAVCPLCQRNKPPMGKIQVTISRKQGNTCAELATAISKSIQHVYVTEACHTSYHITWQVHSLSSHLFGCLLRDLNYGPWPVTFPFTDYVYFSVLSCLRLSTVLKLLDPEFFNPLFFPRGGRLCA
jgi:hypothetical protein